MKVLIIGDGGREQAIALNLSLNNEIKKIYCAPGNTGISTIAECVPINNDIAKLADFAQSEQIDLSIVNSSQLIYEGIVDFFQERKLKIVGPRKEIAKLEWSKYFAKEFMLRRGIPTARYAAFDSPEFAIAYSHSRKLPFVVKADGLAEKKGVAVVESYDRGIAAILACFNGKIPQSGSKVIIEDFIPGTQMSVYLICDGKNHLLLPSVKTYQRLIEGEKGPLTPGIGALSPHPQSTPELINKIKKEIIEPMVFGLEEEGRVYQGILNIELIIDKDQQPYVLEFNCGLRDPDAQVVLPLLEHDLFDLFLRSTTPNRLAIFDTFVPSAELRQSASAACLVLFSDGYPDKVAKGLPIRFKVGCAFGNRSQLIDKSGEIDYESSRVLLFLVETKVDRNRNWVTSGGRVMNIISLSDNLEEALRSVYLSAEKVDFAGKKYRSDLAS